MMGLKTYGVGYGNRPTTGISITASIEGKTLLDLIVLVRSELPRMAA